MIALIRKDLKAYLWMLIGVMVVMTLYSYLCIRFGSIGGIIGLLVVLMPSIVSVVVFIGDQALQYHLFSMPLKRQTIVISKYISTYIIAGTLIVYCLIIMYVISLNYPEAKDELVNLLTLQGLVFSLTPITVIISICYALLFKFGLKIGVKIIMGLFALLYGLGMTVLEKVIQSSYLVARGGIFNAVISYFNTKAYPDIVYLGALFILMVMLMTSVFVAVKAMEKKDI